MRRAFPKLMLAALFASAASAPAADEKKPVVKAEEPAAADWTKFVRVSEVQGEIVKMEANGFQISVPGAPQTKTTGSGKNRRTYQVPGKPVHVSVVFAEGGEVRWSKLPPKMDKDGKKVFQTPEEVQELKKPLGTPGYTADRSDLKAGQIVDLIMVRSKDIPAAKATDSDLLIKRAMILGANPAAKK